MNEEPLQFRVLEDAPLQDSSGDYFGHGEIADSIIDVIKKAPKPFNIGLYGQWGVGKSTICKNVEEKLSKEDKDFKVFYFDTWKYERDSFRRQFLIALDEDLNLNFDFKNKLNQSLTETDPALAKLRFDKELLFSRLGIISLVVLGVGLLGLGSRLVFNWSTAYDLLSSTITALGLATYILQLFVNSISRVQINITKHKTDSAEGFEEHFVEVLAKIQAGTLLVIIDDLDRLSSKNAVSLLSDIKTFLSDEKYVLEEKEVKNKTIFLIPCDNKAINDQLIKEYGEKFDTEEYLRKFFNHSVQIPKLLNLELDKLIVGKLNATNIPEFHDNYDLVFILSYAFRNNPREIIQFINSLISLYLLAKKRGISYIIERNNIAFLAKALVLRVKWPHLYLKIEDRIVRTGDKLDDIVRSLENKEGKEALQKFVIDTSHINDDVYQDIYFSLRQSKEQKTIPEWDSFVVSLIERREDDVKKIYESVKSNNKLRELGNLLSEYCRRNVSNKNLLFNIFFTIHSMIPSEDVQYFQEALLIVFKNAENEAFISSISKLTFSGIFNDGLDGVSSANQKVFSQFITSLIWGISARENIERENIKNIKKLFEIVSNEKNKGLFNPINQSIVDAKKMLFEHIKYQDLFPAGELGDNFRKDILNDTLDVLISLGPVNKQHYLIGLSFFSNLLQWHSIIDADNLRFLVIEKSLEFVNKSSCPSLVGDELQRILGEFTTRIATWYLAKKSVEERSLCVKILQKIDMDANPNKESRSLIHDYVLNTNNDADSILKTLGKDLLMNDEAIRKELINRSKGKIDLLTVLPMKKRLTEDEKAQIINVLIGNIGESIEFLKFIDYSIPIEHAGNQNFLKGIVSRMIEASSLSDANILSEWLEGIGRLGIHSDQVDMFVQKMRQIRVMSQQHAEVISKFMSKNSKNFGQLIVDEFKSNAG